MLAVWLCGWQCLLICQLLEGLLYNLMQTFKFFSGLILTQMFLTMFKPSSCYTVQGNTTTDDPSSHLTGHTIVCNRLCYGALLFIAMQLVFNNELLLIVVNCCYCFD